MLASRLDNQQQRGYVPRSIVRLRDAHRLDVHHERRQHGRAPEQHRPADRGRGGVRQRAPTSRSRRTWSAPARARSILSRSDNPSPCRRMLRARSLTAMIRPRRSSWMTPIRGLSSRAVTVLVRAEARTRTCRTRTNCRIWGSSPVIIAIREDPQPSESAGSPTTSPLPVRPQASSMRAEGNRPAGVVEHGVVQRRHAALERVSVAHDGFRLFLRARRVEPARKRSYGALVHCVNSPLRPALGQLVSINHVSAGGRRVRLYVPGRHDFLARHLRAIFSLPNW